MMNKELNIKTNLFKSNLLRQILFKSDQILQLYTYFDFDLTPQGFKKDSPLYEHFLIYNPI